MKSKNKCNEQINKNTNKETNETGILLNQIVPILSSLTLISNINFYDGEETSFCNLWSLTCPHTCLPFAMPEGLKTMEREGMRSEAGHVRACCVTRE